MKQSRGQWASSLGFILAASGSAVGLGNIWKFPGKVASYGGGAFILCYVLIVALVGFPVMLAEISIGRNTQKNVVGAFRRLNRRWTFLGGIGVITLFVILSYYCVVGGWVLKYIQVYLTGADFGTGATSYQDYFVNFISKPVEPLLWGAVFLALCVYVVVRGVSKGIEKVSKFLMPCLFLILLAIVVRSITLPGAGEGLRYLFTVRPGTVNGNTLVGALGQAFFSLSVGMGIMVTYGSYVSKTENLAKSAAFICGIDTMVAILAGIAIVPVVFVTLGGRWPGPGRRFCVYGAAGGLCDDAGRRIVRSGFLSASVSGGADQRDQYPGKLHSFPERRAALEPAEVDAASGGADESVEHRVFAVAERGAFAEFAMAGLEARAAMAADERGHGKVHR